MIVLHTTITTGSYPVHNVSIDLLTSTATLSSLAFHASVEKHIQARCPRAIAGWALGASRAARPRLSLLTDRWQTVLKLVWRGRRRVAEGRQLEVLSLHARLLGRKLGVDRWSEVICAIGRNGTVGGRCRAARAGAKRWCALDHGRSNGVWRLGHRTTHCCCSGVEREPSLEDGQASLDESRETLPRVSQD